VSIDDKNTPCGIAKNEPAIRREMAKINISKATKTSCDARIAD